MPGANGAAVIWPASGDAVLSNGTNSPTGLAPVNGDCLFGAGGAWTAGTCGASLPSGTQGQPLVNTNGGTTYATSQVYIDASQFTGADPSIQVNACLAAAIAAHATCDARALVSPANASFPHSPQYQITSQQITVGNANNDPVTLILPSFFYWAGGMTDGTSCTLKQYPNTQIIGPGTMNGETAIFGAGPSSNLGYVYCASGVANDSYIYDFGFSVFNQNSSTLFVGHATANNVGSLIAGPFYDETTWDHVNWNDALDTYVQEQYGLCCAAKFESNAWNGEYASIPIEIIATGSGTGSTVAPIIENSSIVHNPSGSPLVTMTDTYNEQSAITFRHIYSESHANTSGTGLYYFNGVGAANLDDVTIKAEEASTTTPAIVTGSGTNTFLQVSSLYMGSASGSFTYPATAVVDGYSTRTIFTNTATAGGFSMLQSWGSTVNTYGVGAQVGYSAAPTSNTGNTQVGNVNTLPPATVTGLQNTAVGGGALLADTSGGSNTGIGNLSLSAITTPSNDTAVGVNAGTNGTTLVTNANSTFVGAGADCSANALTNDTVIGEIAECTASNQAVIGNAATLDAWFGSNGATIEAKSMLHAVGLEAEGVKFTATGCTSITSTLGGATAGSFVIGANSCTVAITMNGATGYTAHNGWSCHANDKTTAAGNTGLYFSANSATTATLTVPSGAAVSDVIDFACTAF